MQPNRQEYQKQVSKLSPPSPLFRDATLAFVIGGGICALAQGVVLLASEQGFPQKTAFLLASLTVMALAVSLTACRVYDNLAKHAGAGTLVPISGFANAIASAAIEFKSEGWILGLGAKMFTIAGPVIVYGTVASVVYGIVLWVIGLF